MAVVLTHQFAFPGRLSQSTFPDLSLTTIDGGGIVVPAHRVVLAAVSAKLRNICEEGGRVMIRNINFVVLKRVVRFIYLLSILVFFTLTIVRSVYEKQDAVS